MCYQSVTPLLSGLCDSAKIPALGGWPPPPPPLILGLSADGDLRLLNRQRWWQGRKKNQFLGRRHFVSRKDDGRGKGSQWDEK